MQVEPEERTTEEIVTEDNDTPVEVPRGVNKEEEEGEGQETFADSSSTAEQNRSVDGEVTVTIGDEEPSEDDTSLVRHLRKVYAKTAKENRDLKRQLASAGTTETAYLPGPKPTPESCDYDAEELGKKLDEWHNKSKRYNEKEAQRQAAEQKAQAEWQEVLDAYHVARGNLKVQDYEQAEETVQGTLSIAQQGMILDGADNPALVVYALGKNPRKAAELARIHNHVKFAFAVAKLESQLKVKPRKPVTTPEKTLTGSAPVTGSTDKYIEKLREDAAKTGDFTKLHNYKRQLRQSATG